MKDPLVYCHKHYKYLSYTNDLLSKYYQHCVVQDFPNLIFFSSSEIIVDPNQVFAMDSSAQTHYGPHEQCDSDSSDNSMGKKIYFLFKVYYLCQRCAESSSDSEAQMQNMGI